MPLFLQTHRVAGTKDQLFKNYYFLDKHIDLNFNDNLLIKNLEKTRLVLKVTRLKIIYISNIYSIVGYSLHMIRIAKGLHPIS